MEVQTVLRQFSLVPGVSGGMQSVSPHDNARLAYAYAEIRGLFPLAPPSIGIDVMITGMRVGALQLIENTPLLMLRGALISGDVRITPAVPIVYRIENRTGHAVCGSVGFAFIMDPPDPPPGTPPWSRDPF